MVEKVGMKGRQKLADVWENHTYIVKRQVAPDIPVYEVQQEGTNRKTRTLHRNMLLPFERLPVLAEPSSPKRRKPREELPVINQCIPVLQALMKMLTAGRHLLVIFPLIVAEGIAMMSVS